MLLALVLTEARDLSAVQTGAVRRLGIPSAARLARRVVYVGEAGAGDVREEGQKPREQCDRHRQQGR